jgi:hypothetical protein
MRVDLNDLAKSITEKEGGKVSMDIAQVKEVLKITLEELAKLPPPAVMRVLREHRK